MKESHKRTLMKTLTWRLLASGMTMFLFYYLSGRWMLSIGIGMLDLWVKMVGYYLHERGWNKVRWGLKRVEVKKEK